MNKQILFLLVAVLFVSISSFAQNSSRTITGQVIDAATGEVLEGVTVSVKGTKNYSGSQPDGIFYIAVTSGDTILVFSFNGYESQEVPITRDTEYNIALRKNYSKKLVPNRILISR